MTKKQVVVTGAAGAIGRAMCEAFGAAGATILAVDRHPGGLEALTSDLRGLGVQVSSAAVDVADEPAVNAWEARLEGRAPQVLINAAGINAPGPFVDAQISRVKDILNVNLVGTIHITQLLARRMARAGAGVILNVTSRLATLPVGNNAAYIASKAGLVAFTKAVAIELGPSGVRANALSPGLIESPMNRATRENPTALARYMSRQTVAGLGQPVDVARVALFLASEQARFINGADVVVDGGFF